MSKSSINCEGCIYDGCLYCPKTGAECMNCPCSSCVSKSNYSPIRPSRVVVPETTTKKKK